VAAAFRDAGLSPAFQEFDLLAYEPEEPQLEVEGELWEAGPAVYAQAGTVEGDIRYLGRHVALPGIFEPLVFALGEGRLYANPYGRAAAFVTAYGPLLTGPAAYVGADDGARLRRLDGARGRLTVRGGFAPRVERNVLARVDGRSEETVVVGAHFDSAWRSPGAVDNASGVAVLVEVARRLAAGPRPERSVLFAAFGSEELQLSGARFFVHEAKLAGLLERVAWMVNVDCAAGDGELAVLHGATPGVDHFAFAAEGVRACSFVRFPYPQYHRPEDTVDLVDACLLEEAVELVSDAVAAGPPPPR
jgi:Iap family predicted aminopeptidase